MSQFKLYEWNEISKDFTGEDSAIILGNGASMAVHQGFSYHNLYEIAIKEGDIKEELDKIFDHLGTKDFELVLRMLWHSNFINQSLGIEDNETTFAYKAVREALIKAVRHNFPNYEDVMKQIDSIAKFLKKFKMVVSLNYDFIVYWSMLIGNEKHGTWFKDCFINGYFKSNWKPLKKPYNAQGATLVFYPHGNLVLATDIYGKEIKIDSKENFSNLVEVILEKWEQGQYSPLFVSEGTTQQKEKAIQRSNYLNTVYNEVLPELGSKIVIFGWSMSDQDEHILKAIAGGNIKSIAVSVHEPTDDKCKTIQNKLQKVFKESKKDLKDNQIIFFDSSSPGCWINDELPLLTLLQAAG